MPFLKYEPRPNANKQLCKGQPYTLPAPPRWKIKKEKKGVCSNEKYVEKSVHGRFKTLWESVPQAGFEKKMLRYKESKYSLSAMLSSNSRADIHSLSSGP